MHCPFCSAEKTQVADSRLARAGREVRRRRKCDVCGKRFTTHELPEQRFPQVIKSGQREEAFDESKLHNSIQTAIGKGSEAEAKRVQQVLDEVYAALQADARARSIPADRIGHCVAAALRIVDHAAYLRFISAWQDFDDAQAFSDAARGLEDEISPELRNRQIDMLADGQNKEG